MLLVWNLTFSLTSTWKIYSALFQMTFEMLFIIIFSRARLQKLCVMTLYRVLWWNMRVIHILVTLTDFSTHKQNLIQNQACSDSEVLLTALVCCVTWLYYSLRSEHNISTLHCTLPCCVTPTHTFLSSCSS